MAYDEELADRIREALGAQDGIVEKRMFGGLGFLIGGNLAVSASGQGGLLVRCAPAETDALVAGGQASRFVMRGREMDGWLRVAPERLGAQRELERWVSIGTDYARSLPAKA